MAHPEWPTTASNQIRLDEIEEAFIIFCAILAGEPADATPDEKQSAVIRYAEIMDRIRNRVVARKESGK